MCGIVGYIGKQNIKDILLDGLSELEYRGYDSAGIAILSDNHFEIRKSVGKIENLRKNTKDLDIDGFSVGIGHTRWATHGNPTDLNSHPHLGEFSFVVHNGIIENYTQIKEELIQKGYTFLSQTDTEVIVHLYEENYKIIQDEFKAFKKTIDTLIGSFAILLITKTAPDKIFFIKNSTPLIIGINEENIFFASSDNALVDKVSEVIYLEDMEYGHISTENFAIYKNDTKIQPTFKTLPKDKLFAKKDGYRFFMEKEIYEQSDIICDTILGRIKDDNIVFDELDNDIFTDINSIVIVACGTSYHASLSAKYLFESISKIPADIEIASEFRYKEPLLPKDRLFICISQSGETADTIECLKIAKNANLKTLCICNVDNSSMVRLSDYSILTRAGMEKGVASTKAFCTQMTILWMLSLLIATYKKTISKEFLQNEIKVLKSLHKVLKISPSLHEKLKKLSKRYLHGHGFFFIGRDIFYPLALEGALKLKEISYLHAEGYPAGEMKHGPIALADSELFTIALLPKNKLYDKMKNNIYELSARDSTICVISPEYIDSADDFIKIPQYEHMMNEYFYMMLIVQLLSMEIAIRLGNDVDMPRNLAKSVTVE
jgi:glucosamine--fructose-6-phosphate aminotransferase (isomerizing)